jgi:pilus assembly protein Flp/PilA
MKLGYRAFWRARLPFDYNRLSERKEPMSILIKSLKQFLVSEDGPTAVEYAVMLGLIIATLIATIQAVGTKANSGLTKTSNLMDSMT